MDFKIPYDLCEELKLARHVIALTGAGTSAESGVPTFRESQSGLWARYDPQQLATQHAFRRNPELIWDWYAWRRSLVVKAEPNSGHFALAHMAKLVPEFTLVTQNVDGLHQQAGSQDVIELHGNIMSIKCYDCGMSVMHYQESDEKPPRCLSCDGFLRPDVVWFGENLSHDLLSRAIIAARHCDVFLSIGTSSLVHPASSLPIEALENGTTTIEVNPVQTTLTSLMTFVLPGPSGIVLPELVRACWPQ